MESKQRISLIFILWCWVDFIQIGFSEIWYYTINFLKQFGFFTLYVGQRPCMTYNCHSTPTPTCQTFMSKIFIIQFLFFHFWTHILCRPNLANKNLLLNLCYTFITVLMVFLKLTALLLNSTHFGTFSWSHRSRAVCINKINKFPNTKPVTWKEQMSHLKCYLHQNSSQHCNQRHLQPSML